MRPIVLLLTAWTLLSAAPAFAEDEAPLVAPDSTKADELAAIVKTVHMGTFDERRRGYQALTFSGITDKQLFDELRDRLDRMYLNAGHDDTAVRELEYLLQALATSGEQVYRINMEKVIDAGHHVDANARKHAEKAINALGLYEKWNETINKPRPGASWALARAENMVESGDLELAREGLKRARELRDVEPAVFEGVERALPQLVRQAQDNEKAEDVAAWACHTLAYSKNSRFKPTLERALGMASGRKLKSHCADALDELSEPEQEAWEKQLMPEEKTKLQQLDQFHSRGYLTDEAYKAKREALVKHVDERMKASKAPREAP